MREFWEFRVWEEHAHLLFANSEGTRIGDSIRKITIARDDPRFNQIGELQRTIKSTGNGLFFSGREAHRRYTVMELANAELFSMRITAVFEPIGEECGTIYDYSEGCAECGMPRVQRSDLRLDLNKLPKNKDIAATIADDEWIVSHRLAKLMADAGLTGYRLAPVRHKAHYDNDPIDLRRLPSGQDMIRRAEREGFDYNSTEFNDWLNLPEQQPGWLAAMAEYSERAEARARRRGKPLPIWHQLVITSKPMHTVPPTRFGAGPFNDDPEGIYRCRYGHIAGLNLLSEVFVQRDEYDGSDVIRTVELVGYPRRPGQTHYSARTAHPLILISPRFRKLLIDNGIKGWKVDVAYLR